MAVDTTWPALSRRRFAALSWATIPGNEAFSPPDTAACKLTENTK